MDAGRSRFSGPGHRLIHRHQHRRRIAGQPGGTAVQAFAQGDTTVGQSNDAGYNVVVDAAAKISALVSVAPSSVKRGGTVTYQVRILNGGTGPAGGVAVLITLPPVMTFAGSVTPFAGNGTRNKGVDPIKNTLEVYYDGFTLPPLSSGGPGFVVIVFKAAVLGAGRALHVHAAAGERRFQPEPERCGARSEQRAVDGSARDVHRRRQLTDIAGDTYSLHAVAPVTVS